MQDLDKRTIGILAGIIFLVVGVIVGLIVVQQRQTLQNEAEEIELEQQHIECSWEFEGNYIISLEDNGGNTVAGPVTVSSGTTYTFAMDPRDIPDPVMCVLVLADDPSCRTTGNVDACEVTPPTPVPTDAIVGCYETCEEDEVLPRCAEGLQCVHNDDGTKTCQDIDGPDACATPTLTATPTATPGPSPTLTLTPTATPTIAPGEPTFTPVPPTPTATPTPTPLACPIPDAVENIVMSCSDSPGKCSWDGSEGADYYLVTIKDRNTNAPIAGFNPNKKVTETEVTFNPVSGHSYICIVEAVNEECGGSSAITSDACSYTAPTATPAPTTVVAPSSTPVPTDISIAQVTNTPTPEQIVEEPTGVPTLPVAGLGNRAALITTLMIVVGISALIIGLAVK